jgi:hypothetical protein
MLLARISATNQKGSARMKNAPKSGTSGRSGNAPAPYTKYRKKRCIYDMVALAKRFPIVNRPNGKPINKEA